MEETLKKLPDAELEVMQALWELEEPICRGRQWRQLWRSGSPWPRPPC